MRRAARRRGGTAAAQVTPAECATPGNDGSNLSLSGVLNTYYPGTASVAAGARCIPVGSPTGAAAPIAAGDLLLVIQMQDATIDAGNTATYGDGTGGLDQAGVTDYRNAGAYEYLAALGAVGSAGGVGCTAGQVPVRGLGTGAGLRNAYRAAARSGSTGRGTFQVVRVPQYRNATLAGDVLAAHWNGSTGGVLALDVTGTLNANGFRLDATGRGFRGGAGRQLSGATGLADTDRRTPAATAANGSKGEGIAGTPRFTFDQATFNAADRTAGANLDNTDEGYNNGSQARGAPGNAGGGGTDGNPSANDQNSGGGGGGNGGAGGRGGNAWSSQDVSGGIGGAAFGAGNGGFAPAVARIVAGGGGGAGTRNNSAAVQSAGGAGGGIILIQAGLFSGSGTIAADGAQGPAPDNDGGGGGGAGGTIVLRDNLTSPFTTLAGYTVRANGAAGSDAWVAQAPGGTPGERHGPGGGGGGGVIWRNTRNAPTELTAGGVAGVTTTAADTFGALPGSGGLAAAFNVRTPGIFPGFECATVPVTLSYFSARAEAGGLTLRFATATETRNVGFRVLAGPAATRRPLGTLVAGAGDAAEPREYLHRVPQADGPLWLADVDVRGQETVHGPFEPGREYGQPPDSGSRVDWAAARAALQQGARNARRGQAPEGAVLWVDTPGLQRVTHEMLLAAGIDLGGVPARELSLSALGQPQQRAVEGGPLFGPGSAIIFHGEPARSLYSDAMPYLLARDVRAVREVPIDDLPSGTPRAAWAMAQAHWAPQRAYAFSAPGPDPWYAARLLALAGQPAGIDVGLPVDAVARVAGAGARLSVSMFGGSDWPDQGADHQVDLRFDGAPLARLSADGLVAFGFDGPLPALPADGTRNLRIEATGATGFDFDVVNIESATLEYPRLPRAVDGRWSASAVRSEPPADNGTPDPLPAPGAGGDLLFGSGFESAASGVASFMLRGLPDGDVVAWRQVGTEWRALADVRTAVVAGGHAAWIPFDPLLRGVPYVAGSRAALLRPRIAPLHAASTAEQAPAEWIAIAPAAFHAALEPLAAARRAQGLRTAIVDIADVFRRHGNLLPTGAAVQSFVREAASRRGTRHVLLAGSDTYDYNDYLGIGAPSIVPTLYAPIDEVTRFAPADALIGDIDGDEVPDVAVGRLPARTADELASAVARVLAWEAGAGRELLVVAGATEPAGSFRTIGDDLATALPGNWNVSRAYVDDLGVAGARAALKSGFDAGPSIVLFVGHSAPSQWTFDPLFTSGDARSLANAGRPALVLQFGCWNAYFVSPRADTLGHALLLSGDRGAAAAFGATALTSLAAHQALSSALVPRLLPGTTLGAAMLAAKREVAATTPGRRDAIIGTALLGDPAMRMR